MVDEPTELPEGSEVELVTAGDIEDPDEWSPELDAELLRRHDDVRAGNHVTADEFLATLRARRSA